MYLFSILILAQCVGPSSLAEYTLHISDRIRSTIFIEHPETGNMTCQHYPHASLPKFTLPSADPSLLIIKAQGFAGRWPQDDILRTIDNVLLKEAPSINHKTFSDHCRALSIRYNHHFVPVRATSTKRKLSSHAEIRPSKRARMEESVCATQLQKLGPRRQDTTGRMSSPHSGCPAAGPPTSSRKRKHAEPENTRDLLPIAKRACRPHPVRTSYLRASKTRALEKTSTILRPSRVR